MSYKIRARSCGLRHTRCTYRRARETRGKTTCRCNCAMCLCKLNSQRYDACILSTLGRFYGHIGLQCSDVIVSCTIESLQKSFLHSQIFYVIGQSTNFTGRHYCRRTWVLHRIWITVITEPDGRRCRFRANLERRRWTARQASILYNGSRSAYNRSRLIYWDNDHVFVAEMPGTKNATTRRLFV